MYTRPMDYKDKIPIRSEEGAIVKYGENNKYNPILKTQSYTSDA